jgi:hypothetical protein
MFRRAAICFCHSDDEGVSFRKLIEAGITPEHVQIQTESCRQDNGFRRLLEKKEGLQALTILRSSPTKDRFQNRLTPLSQLMFKSD